MALRGGRPGPALACFDTVLTLEPDRITSLRAAGRLLMKARRYEDARPYWERLARVAADDPEPHLQLGRIHGKARHYAQAAAEAQAALALAPGNAAVYDLCVRIEAMGRRPGPASPSTAGDAAAAESSMVDSLLMQARRQARAAELGGFLDTLNGLIVLTGPSARLAALAREHRHIIERAGDRRLLALVAGDGASFDAREGEEADLPISLEADARLAGLVRALALGLKHGRIGQVALVVEQLTALSAAEDRLQRVLGFYATEVLACLQRQRGALGPADTLDVEARLAKAYADDAWVIQAMAAQRQAEGSRLEALALYRNLSDSAAGAAPALLHAATLAGSLGTWDEALSFGKRAVAIAGDDRPLISAIAVMFVENNRAADAVTCWRIADAAGRPRLWVRQGIVRCLEKTQDDEARSHEALRCLRDALPLADLSSAEQNYLIDIMRHLVQAHARPRSEPGMADMADTRAILMASEAPSALREWIAASFDLARPDYRAALRHLDDGMAEEPIAAMVALDLHAEKALIYQRYALYGEVVAELALVPPATLAVSSHYRRSFELPRQVASLCVDAAHPMRYPECLFDIIFEEIAVRPIPYAPRSGHVAMVSGSLGAGGGERQTITVVRRLLDDKRIETLSLLVRSTHLRPNDDFFLPQIDALAVDLTIYGQDWPRRTDLAAYLPELRERPG